MKLRSPKGAYIVINGSNDRKRLRKSTDSFTMPEPPFKAPLETATHPIEYEKLSEPELMIITVEISTSEFLIKTTKSMTSVYRKIGSDLYVCSQLPGVYGVVYFGSLEKLPEHIEPLIAEEKSVHGYATVRIYAQSVDAIRSLRSVRDVTLVCTM